MRTGGRIAFAIVAASAGLAATFRAPPASTAAGVYITAPDLADLLMATEPQPAPVLIDIRDRASFELQHLPTALNLSPNALRDRALTLPSGGTVVVYGDDQASVDQAQAILRERGYRNVRVLRDGVYEWVALVVEPRLAEDATEQERQVFDRAARHSRFFGGEPRSGMPRAQLWPGRWAGTGTSDAGKKTAGEMARRRGCG